LNGLGNESLEVLRLQGIDDACIEWLNIASLIGFEELNSDVSVVFGWGIMPRKVFNKE
jgi:hypothetical protein